MCIIKVAYQYLLSVLSPLVEVMRLLIFDNRVFLEGSYSIEMSLVFKCDRLVSFLQICLA